MVVAGALLAVRRRQSQFVGIDQHQPFVGIVSARPILKIPIRQFIEPFNKTFIIIASREQVIVILTHYSSTPSALHLQPTLVHPGDRICMRMELNIRCNYLVAPQIIDPCRLYWLAVCEVQVLIPACGCRCSIIAFACI